MTREIRNEIKGERRTYAAASDTHSHDYAQLLLPLEGELSIKTEAQNLQVDQQTVFFIPPGCNHTFHSVIRNEFLIVDIPFFMLPKSELHFVGIPYKMDSK
ncbi:AraC family ligand binding domain-containing protein [Sporosarcina sp.]|uniref:AraC family ligand binding domain-containing protein n=1 Tax=Sporosarcina sp. TaxID=49982 RepID=UPI00261C6D1D|nr:AraC family ligand binding domain-containing protein [Sporosarcina sp.]